jgi:hypothetical protein
MNGQQKTRKKEGKKGKKEKWQIEKDMTMGGW